MLFQPKTRRNGSQTWCSPLRLGLLCLLWPTGCSMPSSILVVWQKQAELEQVTTYGFGGERPGDEWFARVIQPPELPRQCIHRLSEKFDFVLVDTQEDWSGICRATNLDPALPPPDFSDGLVLGLLAGVGQARQGDWPAIIRSVRRRGTVAFLVAEFNQGFLSALESSALPAPHLRSRTQEHTRNQTQQPSLRIQHRDRRSSRPGDPLVHRRRLLDLRQPFSLDPYTPRAVSLQTDTAANDAKKQHFA